MVFSHELVHVIGGHSDSNNNMTRRLLLLLESRSLQNGLARKQIMKAILERYFEEDTHFRPTGKTSSYVPRFLVNDIVRFWRTICVDYASKHRAEAGRKWALRNIKLRFSRKLLFAAGLIVAFECHLNPPPMRKKGYARFSGAYDEPNTTLFINHIMPYLEWTPLEILAHAVEQYACNAKVADLIFGSYNQFLKQIDDKNIRKFLEKMDYKTAQKDDMYNELRDLSHQFQEGLNLLFFPQSKSKLSVLTQKYGLF